MRDLRYVHSRTFFDHCGSDGNFVLNVEGMFRRTGYNVNFLSELADISIFISSQRT